MFNLKQVKTDNTVTKRFKYSKGTVNLDFSLRTDIKNQLKDFLECLKVAQKEVEQELIKHK